MLVDGWPNVVVQAYQFPVDIQRCPILRTLDFLLDTLYQIQVLATVRQHLQILHSHEMKHTFFSGHFTIQRKRKQLAFNSTNEKTIQTCRVVHNDNHSCPAPRLSRTAVWWAPWPMCWWTSRIRAMGFISKRCWTRRDKKRRQVQITCLRIINQQS